MSYDINFWKQERSLELTNEEIYAKLCSGEAVDGLARLPTDKILQRLRERFPAFDPSDDFPDVELEALDDRDEQAGSHWGLFSLLEEAEGVQLHE